MDEEALREKLIASMAKKKEEKAKQEAEKELDQLIQQTHPPVETDDKTEEQQRQKEQKQQKEQEDKQAALRAKLIQKMNKKREQAAKQAAQTMADNFTAAPDNDDNFEDDHYVEPPLSEFGGIKESVIPRIVEIIKVPHEEDKLAWMQDSKCPAWDILEKSFMSDPLKICVKKILFFVFVSGFGLEENIRPALSA